jgi:two-component system, chemotaxis family, chemotaxis protein CheY
MKTLIVEDDFTSRLLLQELLKHYGPVHVAVNGREAVDAVASTMKTGEHYDLICLDIMLPEMNGQEVLKKIRTEEEKVGIKLGKGVKVIMTTALNDPKNIMSAFREQCDTYLVKPIDSAKLIGTLRESGLI